MVTALLLTARLAAASDSTPITAIEEQWRAEEVARWERVERNGRRTSMAGQIVGLAGVGLVVTGTAVAAGTEGDVGIPLLLAGLGVGQVGSPLAAGGAMRARHAVRHLNQALAGDPLADASRVPSPWPGVGAWSLIPGLLPITVGFYGLAAGELLHEEFHAPVDPWLIRSVGIWGAVQLGSLSLSLLQLQANEDARMRVSVVPTLRRDSMGVFAEVTW